jgi:hydroxymethylpyrimidine pyrophosphatase-like HAD family hydrolase
VPEDARKINVLQAADEITLSNDEDGTVKWLADNCLKETKER